MESNKAFAVWGLGLLAMTIAVLTYVTSTGLGEVPPLWYWAQDLSLGLGIRWYTKCTPSDSADWLLW